MTTPSGEQHGLVLGDQAAVVVEVGGGLRTYTVAGNEIVDGFAMEAMADAGRGQLLAPWPNRIEDGRYTFEGMEQHLPLTEPANNNAIHGLVRWVSWTPVERDNHHVALTYLLHPQPGYPFLLRLRVDYTLTPEGLRVQMTATNEGDVVCPYGTGAHPYLRLSDAGIDDLVLTSPAGQVLVSDARAIPRSRQPVAGTRYDFRSGQRIGDLVLDHAFTDLARDADGRARVVLSDPSTGRALEVWMDESCGHVMVFSADPLPAEHRRKSLAVEPMTCPPNAFRTGEDLIRLEPGASTTSTWGLRALAS